jgi:hypothetical protein
MTPGDRLPVDVLGPHAPVFFPARAVLILLVPETRGKPLAA